MKLITQIDFFNISTHLLMGPPILLKWESLAALPNEFIR